MSKSLMHALVCSVVIATSLGASAQGVIVNQNVTVVNNYHAPAARRAAPHRRPVRRVVRHRAPVVRAQTVTTSVTSVTAVSAAASTFVVAPVRVAEPCLGKAADGSDLARMESRIRDDLAAIGKTRREVDLYVASGRQETCNLR